MLTSLSRWLEQGRRKRSAVKAALHRFNTTTGKPAHPGMSSVIGEKAGDLIVRVCFGNTKPPARVWYLVGLNTSVISELSFEEAQEFGECLWR